MITYSAPFINPILTYKPKTNTTFIQYASALQSSNITTRKKIHTNKHKTIAQPLKVHCDILDSQAKEKLNIFHGRWKCLKCDRRNTRNNSFICKHCNCANQSNKLQEYLVFGFCRSQTDYQDVLNIINCYITLEIVCT
eukprot:503428_1